MRSVVSKVRKLFTDVMFILRNKQQRQTLLKTPLYYNAIYLMLANVMYALFGFLFWILAARFYSPEDVGLASAVLSSAGLLSMLSGLGIGDGILRFLDTSKVPQKLINTGFNISGLLGLLAAAVFVLGLSVWSPALKFIREDPLYLAVFVLYVPATNLSTQIDQAFMAKRRGGLVLGHTIIFNILRLILPVFLAIYFGSFGIFGSLTFAMVISLGGAILFFLPRASPGYQLRLAFDRKIVAETVSYSFTSYLGGLFWSAPGFLLPLLVINQLSAEENAYFYVAYAMGTILTTIPTAIATSLIAEGSHNENSLQQNAWRSLKMTFLLLTPAVALFVLLADKLLLIYGREYIQNGVVLLRWQTLAALPMAVNILFFSVKRVQKKLKSVILFGMLNCALNIMFAAVLLPSMGINGAGIAWFISQLITAVAVIGYTFYTRFQ
jgi:O-antigen/teichoic acid export membrane protein